MVHSFAFVIEGDHYDDFEAIAEAIYANGGDDSTVSCSEGIVTVAFDREADKFVDAVKSASEMLDKLGYKHRPKGDERSERLRELMAYLHGHLSTQAWIVLVGYLTGSFSLDETVIAYHADLSIFMRERDKVLEAARIIRDQEREMRLIWRNADGTFAPEPPHGGPSELFTWDEFRTHGCNEDYVI